MEITSRLTALFLLIALIPLLVIIALVSLIIQGLPIIFIQPRVGKNFKKFNIYKFRTIKNKGGDTIISHSGDLLQVSKWGKFLRKTKLDELPQLLNVIKGDMRFIGPRPEVPKYVNRKTFSFLKKIKPGLSGYSSIIFRNESDILSMIESDDPYQEILNIKLALDNYYVTKKSFSQDFKLVVLTIFSLFTPKRMGHYLFIKLLRIESNEESNLNKIVDNIRMKMAKYKEVDKNNGRNRRVIILLDMIIIFSSLVLSSFVGSNFTTPILFYVPDLNYLLVIILGVKLSANYICNLYQGMWRYTSITDIFQILKASFLSTFIIFILFLTSSLFKGLSLELIFIDLILSILFTSSTRLSIRLIYSHLLNPSPYRINFRKRVILIGAGKTGEFICRELLNNPKHLMDPIGFLDDNHNLKGKFIHSRKVFGKISNLTDYNENYDEALICCPNAQRKELFNIFETCKDSGKPFRILPSPKDILSGSLSLDGLKEVSILDLIGKNEVSLDEETINEYIHGKRILITGAGGTIGSELVRQCLKYEPALLVLIDKHENSLMKLEREVLSQETNVLLKPILSNIRDFDILSKIYSNYEPQIVFHAASYKYVSIQEAFPWEALETNINGTSNLVKLSSQHNVEKFILISTDKAERPINIMSATKRLAEVICQGANSSPITRFMAVRFGNLIDSKSSFISVLKEQIDSGGPVTITDPEMERYFMSSKEAAQLILQSGAFGNGGEIFSLDMGSPIKILDIANELIKLSGMQPGTDIPVSFIGTRAGESIPGETKLLNNPQSKTGHKKISVVHPNLSDVKIKEIANRIIDGALTPHEYDRNILRSILTSLIPEYEPLKKDEVEPLILKASPKAQA
ncbi:MAG: hypothetical protein CMG63_02290 [Candidatus Marinimicrobia bacterium]|nr:hypothetical protein [Candidatus Neomarinimicrobiota bacterium]